MTKICLICQGEIPAGAHAFYRDGQVYCQTCYTALPEPQESYHDFISYKFATAFLFLMLAWLAIGAIVIVGTSNGGPVMILWCLVPPWIFFQLVVICLLWTIVKLLQQRIDQREKPRSP